MVAGGGGRAPGIAAAAAALLTACGGGSYAASVAEPRIELQTAPAVSYDASNGKTTVALEFLVRDAAGNPVDPATTTVRRYVDGRIADVESVVATEDTRLASSLRLGVVLDASLSMARSGAFEPMKQAAHGMLQSIRGQFSSAGSFTPTVSWFQDQYVCMPSPLSIPDAAVLDIPTPTVGASTRLFAATAGMVDHLRRQYEAIPAPTSSDRFALVVFTDGHDNYSSFDSSAAPPITVPVTGGAFVCDGTGATDLNSLVAAIRAFPQLRTYAIGLGNEIYASELTAIASAGGGRLVTNPSTAQVSTLFDAIAREFTTIRRDGITAPVVPGDHDYMEEVAVGGAYARIGFRFHTGDANAAVVPGSVRAR
jgi:hypothetical protein